MSRQWPERHISGQIGAVRNKQVSSNSISTYAQPTTARGASLTQQIVTAAVQVEA